MCKWAGSCERSRERMPPAAAARIALRACVSHMHSQSGPSYVHMRVCVHLCVCVFHGGKGPKSAPTRPRAVVMRACVWVCECVFAQRERGACVRARDSMVGAWQTSMDHTPVPSFCMAATDAGYPRSFSDETNKYTSAHATA
jgi:hypothetical protein